jgi:predicted nucleotidyltransferase
LGGRGVDREKIVATLRVYEAELRRRGVRHAALFGSVARRESKRSSDIDVLIELDPQAPVGLFEYVEITQFLTDLFPVRVDVANRSTLKPLVRPTIERDAIYAF